MTPIRKLTLSGTPFDLGVQHGAAYRDDIRRYAADRIQLVMGGQWSGKQPLSRADVLAIAEACIPAHQAYAPDLMEELRGLVEATGLSLAELIIVGGFTDFVDTVYAHTGAKGPLAPDLAIDDCTAFIIPDAFADGAGFLGQTWDMHDSATEFVVLLDVQPADGPRALVFTTTGCVGQIGMNAHGIAVGINNLLGADGGIGVTWPFVIRKVLQQETIEAALACITGATLAGAHNYLLFDAHGSGYNIEAMSTRHHVQPLAAQPLIHTNHCLIPATNAVAQPRLPASQANSEARLALAAGLLQKEAITIEDLQALTRADTICQVSAPPFHIESCGAMIMRPQGGEVWAVWGRPAENAYEHFSMH
jgi:isopenicillin-N N-acyltransferase-like protein